MKRITALTRSIIMLFMLVVSMNAFAQNDITGEWKGISADSSTIIIATLNADTKEALNPYEPESLCNGFISVKIKEPSGMESLLATYELTLSAQVGILYEFTYKPGRPGVDEGNGKCSATLENGTFHFQVSENSDGIPVPFTDIEMKSINSSVSSGTANNNGNVTGVSDSKDSIWDTVLSIVLFVAMLAMFVHMAVVLIKGKRYKVVFTPEQVADARKVAEKPSESSPKEDEEVEELLEKAYLCWSEAEPDEEGNEMRQPTSRKQIKTSCSYLDQAIALQTTDPDLLSRLNDLTNVINLNEKRIFDGSKVLVWLGGIFGVLSFFLFDVGLAFSILFSTGVYIIASRTPLFLVLKRQKRGGGNIHNGIVGGVLAMIAGAKTVRTIYKFDDGTRAYKDDHSQHWIALVLGLIILVMLAVTMIFWAILNYLRNYIIYF